MKCSKCNNERHGSLAYCKQCNADYMKTYRLSKLEKMQKPVDKPKAEPQASEPIPKKPQAHSPVYWSYYLTPGTALHKSMLAYEATMMTAG